MSDRVYDEAGGPSTRMGGRALQDRVTAHEPLELAVLLRTDDGGGTPEYRAWIDRARQRHGMVS